MFRDDYKALFDSVNPPSTLERQTEREIQKMLQPKPQRSIRRTICIAAAAAVLMIGVAFAAISASGILDRLFPYDEPSEAARQSVIRDSASVSENGVTLNMDEYLFDNNTLHLSWTVSSGREKPVYYTSHYDYSYENPDDLTIAEESVGGFYGDSTSGEIGDGAMVRLSGTRPSYSGYASYSYCAPLNSTVNARVIIRAYETDCVEEDVPLALFWDIAEDAELCARLEANRRIGIAADGMTSIHGYAAFNEALQRLVDSGMDWDAANEAAIVESGFFKEVAVLEITVPVEPGSAAEPVFSLEEETRFDLSDASVILKQFEIDTASTMLEYEVITDKLLKEGGAGNGVAYILFDQNGHPLNADCLLSMSGGQVQDREGRHAYLISVFGNPIPESVTSVTFVPTCDLERRQESSNSYYLRMKQMASPEQCFTLEIR